MRKLIAVLFAGLFLVTLSACGSSSNKAKTSSSDTDSSDTDSTDSDSGSDSNSSSDSSSNGGGGIQAFCDEIKTASASFNDIADVPSDSQIDALVKELLKLKAVAPDEIGSDMKTFVDLEVAAARAAKAAEDTSDAQESAANTVLDKAGDSFFAAASKVDDFAIKQCGVGLSGQTASDSASTFSTTGSSIN